jgi:uncharacterized lipoprotein NlpE involved in copper resistance
MKKIILSALTAFVMMGCENSVEKDTKLVDENYHVIIYDSCEYISGITKWDLTHKGNCRFCKERRQKELKDIVEQLKEK